MIELYRTTDRSTPQPAELHPVIATNPPGSAGKEEIVIANLHLSINYISDLECQSSNAGRTGCPGLGNQE
jgi:hypothetical protein